MCIPSPILHALCVAGALLASGCSNLTPQIASSRFQQSVDASGSTLGSYFTEINDFDRRIYLDSLQETAIRGEAKPIEPHRLLGKILTTEDIQLRVRAVAMLAIYARRLAERSGLDLYASIAPFVAAQGADAQSTKTAQGTRGAPARDPSAAARTAAYTEQIARLESILLEGNQRVASEDARDAVQNVLALLDDDVKASMAVVSGLYKADIASGRVDGYNKAYLTLNTLQRQRSLADIDRMIQRHERLSAVNPSELVAGIREVCEALFRFANSNSKTTELRYVIGVAEQLDSRVQRNSELITELRSLRITPNL
jgi:hypothetical protein